MSAKSQLKKIYIYTVTHTEACKHTKHTHTHTHTHTQIHTRIHAHTLNTQSITDSINKTIKLTGVGSAEDFYTSPEQP